MKEHKLDAVIAAGGPSHWSFGAGMLWLTGHFEWHALACYVLVPLDGEPTMIYSMGGTHAEAVRRNVEVAVKDVRHSRNGKYAEVMVERLKELKLERGRIGLMEIDPRHEDYMPVNQYNTLRAGLPDAELVFTKNFLHELVVIHSAEELDCVRKAGVLCQRAMEAMVARAKPGAKEYELRAAAGAAILDGGGDIDFLIIGSTPMENPAMIFGNPRAVAARAAKGRHHQHGAGRRLSRLHRADRLADHARPADRHGAQVLGGHHAARLSQDRRRDRARQAGRSHAHGSRFFRDNGVQSRPTQCHGIDLVTDNPHVSAEHVRGLDVDMVLKPGMVIMAEPNPITADGLFGIFLGHTFIVNETGHEIVDKFPLEIAVAR